MRAVGALGVANREVQRVVDYLARRGCDRVLVKRDATGFPVDISYALPVPVRSIRIVVALGGAQ